MRLFTSLSPTLPVQLRFPPYVRLPLALSPLSVLRYHAWVRYLTGLALVVFLFAVFATSVTANGGMLVYREQQGGYDIAVTVWPPEPKTGLLVFTVLIQAVAATNGGDEAHLAPISSDLILRGEGPSGTTVGPFQPQTVLPGFSHFDVRIPWVRMGSGRSHSTSPDPLETFRRTSRSRSCRAKAAPC